MTIRNHISDAHKASRKTEKNCCCFDSGFLKVLSQNSRKGSPKEGGSRKKIALAVRTMLTMPALSSFQVSYIELLVIPDFSCVEANEVSLHAQYTR